MRGTIQVSYYLDAEVVGETLEFVSQSSHNESAIAFDYTISVSGEIINQYGVKEFFLSMKEHHHDESLMFAIDEGKIELYLEQRGLEIIDHLGNNEIEREFLVIENGSLIGRVTGHFRFVLALPKR